MNQTLLHRGPDGEGFFHDENISLAMRRLSIIDLKSGWQPLYNETKSLVLITNGEIYNYIELRKKLEQLGHIFSTNSDCETILHLYEEYGIECIQHLRGMFAFALWDTRKKQLLLARDRMGEKPLYYHVNEHSIYFASELKTLLSSGKIPFNLNPTSIHNYFHYHYVPEPATPIENINKLDAGHFMIINCQNWDINTINYWKMEDIPPIEGNPINRIREELDHVSEIVIRSDVPVGIALSGGLDSSAVAALASRKYPDIMHSFSVGYEGEDSSDERKDAKALADHLKMPFHEIILRASDMVDFFPELNYWRDDPIADISGFSYHAISKCAREANIPVLLQGQGGDELFWGYPWVRQSVFESQQKEAFTNKKLLNFLSYFQIEKPLKNSPGSILDWMRKGFGTKKSIEKFIRHSSTNPDQLVFFNLTDNYQYAQNKLGNLYTKEFLNSVNWHSPDDYFCSPHPWENVETLAIKIICETYLRENGISQGDRLSMASSIEMRLPLIDYKLVETVIGLRKSQSDIHQPAKYWLRQAVKDILPDWVMNRPKKGFTPSRKWAPALFDKYGKLPANGYLADSKIINPKAYSSLLSQSYQNGDFSFVFSCLVLEMWCRQFSIL